LPLASGPRPRVVVIGAGFAGLNAVRGLARADADVTVVDASNHHLFQPLLYQVATAALSPADVASPVRKILRRQRNARVLFARARGVDLDRRVVQVEPGDDVPYDVLIVAVGLETTWFGHDAWRSLAPGLKTLGDALDVRRRVLLAFERAERETDEDRRRALLTFVLVGAGPTGVEMAGALAEIARHTLVRDFRAFDPRTARIVLIEGRERVLPEMTPESSAAARADLRRLGVEVITGSRVETIDADGVVAGGARIAARTVVWAAGVRGVPLLATLGTECTRDGRVVVESDCSLPGRPEVFVIGDGAAVRREDGAWVPAMAPPAIQMGRQTARNVRRRMRGRPTKPFRYRDKGTLATVGRSRAVAEIGAVRVRGSLAWALWVVVHVFHLIGFRNRFAVLFEWAWAWVTNQRGARILVEGAADETARGSAGL
jgi:NADH dehydrogenase